MFNLKRRTKFEILLILIIISRSTSFMFSKITMDVMGPFTILANRYFIAFFIMSIIYFKGMKNTDKNTLIKGIIIGAIYTAVMGLEMYGLKYTDSGTCSFLEHTAIVIVPFIQALLVKKFPEYKVIISSVIALTGVGLLTLSAINNNINIGYVYCLLAAIVYAFAIIYTTDFSLKVKDSVALGIWQVGFMGLFTFILAIFTEDIRLPHTTPEWFSILYLAIVCTCFGLTLQPFAQSGTTANRAALIAAFNPLSVAIIGVVLLHEKLTVTYVLGGILIIVAILLSINSESLSVENNENKG